MRDTQKTIWGYRHVILVVIWTLYIINYFDRIAVLTFLPYIQKDLALTTVQIGWLGSIFFFGYSLAQPFAGYLADKFGPKKLMNVAIIVFTGITFLTGFVKNFWQFIALRIGLALGEGQHFAPAMRTIANWFPKEEKGRASGFFSTTWAVAPAIVPILVTQLAAGFFDGAWRPVFFVLAVPGIIGIWLLWRYIDDSPKTVFAKGRMSKSEYDLIVESVNVDASEHGKTYSSKIYLKDVQFYIYTISMFLMVGIWWGMSTWLSTFLVKQHGLNLRTMGIYASLPYVVAFFAMYFGGWMSDKLFQGRPKYVTMISLVGCIPAFYLIGQVSKGETNSLIFFLCMGGFFINLAWGMMYAFPSWRYPKEMVGRTIGVSNGFGQFGAFVFPVVAGYLVTTLPDNSLDFSKVFYFFSGAALVGTLFVGFLKEKMIEIDERDVAVEVKQVIQPVGAVALAVEKSDK